MKTEDVRATDVAATFRSPADLAPRYGGSESTDEALRAYAGESERLLANIVATLDQDERVVAAWLAGSFGRGEGDAWADYDLYVAIEDEAIASFLADRPQLFASLGTVILLQNEIPNSPPVEDRFNLVNFASTWGPIEVDWSFVSVSEARKQVGHVALFEKRPIPLMEQPALSPSERAAEARRWWIFFWAMAPIAVKLAARGDARRAADQTELMSRALIGLWRLTEHQCPSQPWQPEANRPLEDSFDARLPRLTTVVTPSRALLVVEQLCELAVRLHGPVSELGAPVDLRMVEQLETLVRMARREIARGRFPRRKFR